MKVVGIIAEYNPFHKGHQYLIEEVKRLTKADYCIIAMSGDFLQRGEPAICNKFNRARMALSCGADLVLELPAIWSTASAEYFAKAGVSLLSHTGVVTHLGFGSETEDLPSLQRISSILLEEPSVYKEALSTQLKKGMSFPTARKQAVLAQLSQDSIQLPESLLDSPNNILALEYLKALTGSIRPIVVKRQGAGYHDEALNVAYPSATAIRKALTDSQKSPFTETLFQDAMPKEAADILLQCINEHALLHTSDFDAALGHRLLMLSQEGYADFADATVDLSNKIKNHLGSYHGYEDFCMQLKSKDITYTRISRLLLHILLDIRQSDYEIGKRADYAPYLRILGFRKDAGELLSAIKQHASVPMISKVADAKEQLSAEAYTLFQKDLFASALYQQTLTVRKGVHPSNDFTTPCVILS